MLVSILDFLSAYYPRFLCLGCVAKLMFESEAAVRAALAPATPQLQYANAECMNCSTRSVGVRHLAKPDEG